MNTKNSSGVLLTGVSVKGQKAKYQAPELCVYGAVSQLTAGAGGTKADMFTQTKMA